MKPDATGFIRFERPRAPVVTEPLVTIQKRGIFSLNWSAYEALGKPLAAQLSFNPSEQIIRINRGAPKARASIPVRKEQHSAVYAITGSSFTREFAIDTQTARRYRATVRRGELYIDLKQPGIEALSWAARRKKTAVETALPALPLAASATASLVKTFQEGFEQLLAQIQPRAEELGLGDLLHSMEQIGMRLQAQIDSTVD